MTNELKLTLPLPTSVNHIYGRSKFGGTYLKKEGKDYKKNAKDYLEDQTKIQKWNKLNKEQYCYSDTVVYMNKKGRDADNLYKLIQDSITESLVVWEDDTYVWSRTKRVYIDSKNPRVEIIITPTDTIGIFDSNEEYKEFISRCNNCSNFKRNCKKLESVLENRIIPEVTKDEDNKWKCNKFKQVK